MIQYCSAHVDGHNTAWLSAEQRFAMQSVYSTRTWLDFILVWGPILLDLSIFCLCLHHTYLASIDCLCCYVVLKTFSCVETLNSPLTLSVEIQHCVSQPWSTGCTHLPFFLSSFFPSYLPSFLLSFLPLFYSLHHLMIVHHIWPSIDHFYNFCHSESSFIVSTIEYTCSYAFVQNHYLSIHFFIYLWAHFIDYFHTVSQCTGSKNYPEYFYFYPIPIFPFEISYFEVLWMVLPVYRRNFSHCNVEYCLLSVYSELWANYN